MFDNKKIQILTDEFQKFIKEHENFYILDETFPNSENDRMWEIRKRALCHPNIMVFDDIFTLIKHFDVKVISVLVKTLEFFPQTEICGYPVLEIKNSVEKLHSNNGLIVISRKPSENFNSSIKLSENLNFHAFTITVDEAVAMYSRILVGSMLDTCKKDGLRAFSNFSVSNCFAQGMTSFLEPNEQNIKIQFMNRLGIEEFAHDDVDDVGIVIQGPLTYENDYTIYTAKLYRQWYPNIPIIISTWKNEATEEFRQNCHDDNIILLENDLPAKSSGMFSLDFQAKSSLEGLKYLTENFDVKFALKCRTDQRFYKRDFLLYFKNLLKLHPPLDDKMKDRFIVSSYTHLWIAFFVEDFYLFGNLSDVLKFYDLSMYSRSQETQTYQKFFNHMDKFSVYSNKMSTWLDLSESQLKNIKKINSLSSKAFEICPQIIFAKNFYKKNIREFDQEEILDAYHDFLKNYTIIVNDSYLLFEWCKYEDNRRYNTRIAYNYKNTTGTDFSVRLDLYLNPHNI